jgi:hypothetical protein
MTRQKLQGQQLRTVLPTVQILIPLYHIDDLPQIARRLRELADHLIIIQNAEHLREAQKFSDAYAAVRNTNQTIKRECPK